MEPILRWAGSKRRLIGALSEAAPSEFRRYLEPFVGSGIYYLRTNATEGVLNDINRDLMEAYRVVALKPRAVWKRVAAMSTDESFYYELRSVNPAALSSLDRAARFIYLNRFCFNGVYRTNLLGQFNVSRGKGHLFVPTLDAFLAFSRRIRGMQLLSEDFESVIDRAGAGDFLYLDPPYALEGQRDRGQYGLGTFRERDERRLLLAMVRAHRRGARMLLSYTPREQVLEVLNDWIVTPVTVDRKVASKCADRRDVREIIMSNYQRTTEINARPGRNRLVEAGDCRRPAFRNSVHGGEGHLDAQSA